MEYLHNKMYKTKLKYYCKICGKKISLQSGLYGSGMCRKCSNTIRNKSIKMRQLVSQSKIGKPRLDMIGDKNPAKRPEVRIKISKIMTGRKVTWGFKKGKNHPDYNPEKHKTYYCKEKGCNNIICYQTWKYGLGRCKSCHQKGKRSHNFGKITSWKRIKYKGIWMRSSWELLFAQFLDLSGIKWEYESETFDLGNTTYTPDFYIPEWDLYVEIKGWFRKEAKYKYRKFKELYKDINIKIYNKKKLKHIGVL